jgi:hypothetical protein
MPSPADYPDSHPGWDRLLGGLEWTSDRHPPGHWCPRCANTRTVYDLATEIVETWERSRHPALSTIVANLKSVVGWSS